MPAGRRPKPSHLRIVGGNAGKRPLPKGEPRPARTIPSVPGHVTPEARVAWGRLSVLLDRMGVLTEADAYALERLAELYAEIVSLTGVLHQNGRTYETVTETGSTIVRPRPEVVMLADADRRFRAYMVEFGLTPASRVKVKDGGAAEKTQDPAEKYFG